MLKARRQAVGAAAGAGREDDLARIETGFTTAETAQDENWPDPGDDEQDAGNFETGGCLSDNQPNRNTIPPPALSFEQKF